MSTSRKDAGKEVSGKDTRVYHLMLGDNPGTLITQVQLRPENFDEWTMAVKTALRAKKKFGFIDGSVKQPSKDAADLEDWWQMNSMIVSWLFNTMEPTLRSTITYIDLAKDLWDELQ